MSRSGLNTGIIIQARTGSRRLPKKMTLPFYQEESILQILIRRFKKELGQEFPVVVATTTNPADDPIQSLCEKEAVQFFRGPENDVLLRFIQVAESFNFDDVIRICADNPLLDLSETLDLLEKGNISDFDYLGYQMKNNKPSIQSHLGFWGEVVSVNALKKVHDLTEKSIYREHVTNYIYQNPDQFQVELINLPEKIGNREEIRLTVDTLADFDIMKEIYSKLIDQKIKLDPLNIINFLDQNPTYLEMMKVQIAKNRK